MKKQSLITGLSILLLSQTAHAIPPPDAVISIWQSLLQFLGVASVFVGGAILSMRQFFGMYITGWKRVVFYLALGVVVLWLVWLFFGGQIAKANAAPLVKGELISVQDVIKREKNDWIREWKLATIEEMKQELNMARRYRKLPQHPFSLVQSFSPKHLHQLVTSQHKPLYLLDIREAFERSQFGISVNSTARYGDLAADIMPRNVPKNALVVVLCHSGLRGYLGASLLKAAGYSRAAFLQGGLGAWKAQKLPISGDPDYSAKKRWMPSEQQAAKLNAIKVQVDAEGSKLIKGLPDVIKLPYETATTNDLLRVMKRAKNLPILLACNTYGGCFHSTNMSWLIEQKGGKVAGIYDESGEHLVAFFD
ncbi:MAG: rhodanese-like domain-containing protein [Leucothrix sp.]